VLQNPHARKAFGDSRLSSAGGLILTAASAAYDSDPVESWPKLQPHIRIDPFAHYKGVVSHSASPCALQHPRHGHHQDCASRKLETWPLAKQSNVTRNASRLVVWPMLSHPGYRMRESTSSWSIPLLRSWRPRAAACVRPPTSHCSSQALCRAL
jgi:hypothetical protein